MNTIPILHLPVLLLLLAAGPALAYEEEEALPLYISTHNEYSNIGKVRIRLVGGEVQITAQLLNKSDSAKRIGFVAQTPLFTAPEIAEDNKDKHFPSLKVTLDGAPVKTAASQRAVILGDDVTRELRKVGIPPLPDAEANTRKKTWRGLPLDGWSGQVAHSWIPTLGAKSDHTQVISYRALPQFGRDELGGVRFSEMLRRHCGEPAQVKASLRSQVPNIDFVMFERYEIPVSFLRGREVDIEVSQRPDQRSGKEPLRSFMCGLQNIKGDGASFNASMAQPENTVSVLIISSFPGSVRERTSK